MTTRRCLAARGQAPVTLGRAERAWRLRPDGNATDAAETLAWSAARGCELAALLDPDTPVPGVTPGTLRPDIAVIAVPATVDGRHMTGDDFALTAGWGHYGTGEAVMPGQGRIVERDYTADEHAALVGATGRSICSN